MRHFKVFFQLHHIPQHILAAILLMVSIYAPLGRGRVLGSTGSPSVNLKSYLVCYFLSLWKASYCLESQGSYTLRSVCFLQLTHRWRIDTPRNFFRCSYHIEWSGLAMKADWDTLEGTSSLKHSLPSWNGLFVYRSYRLINLSFFNVSKRVIVLVIDTQWITVTVWLLKPGPLVEDYPIRAFFENKILNFFFLQTD